MTFYIFIFVALMAGAVGYSIFMNKKYSAQSKIVGSTDLKAEFANAERYKSEYLASELPFLKKAMGDTPIDAYTYGNAEYTTADALKDGLKNKLKEVATLGTVRFDTVVTPKYLVLSGDTLHLFDTNTDGEIKDHLVFGPDQLQNARLILHPMEGQIKAQAEARSKNVRAYKLLLPAKNGKAFGLIIYSCLIFTDIPEYVTDPQKTIKSIVIGNDFLKQLGDKYPAMKVSLPILG